MRHRTSPEERALEELRRLRSPKRPPPSQKKKRPPWVRYTAAALLALLCIGGAELLACRFFEPALYEEVVEPARWAARQVSRAGRWAWAGVCQAGRAAAQQAGDAAAALSQGAREAREDLRAWMEEMIAPPEPEPPEAEEDSTLAQPEIAPPKELLDPLISDLVQRGDLLFLTGGGVDVVYYNQTDEARADQMYGTDRLSTHGCGPTAMAMAVSSLTEETVDPEDMARLCVKQGYWCKSHGSYLSIVQGVAEAYGLRCESVDLAALEEDALYARLSTGDLAVALMTKGHFTKGGHFILLRGVTLSGEILVADPASQDRSLIPWDLSLILEELSPSRHNGAPLWILSKAE